MISPASKRWALEGPVHSWWILQKPGKASFSLPPKHVSMLILGLVFWGFVCVSWGSECRCPSVLNLACYLVHSFLIFFLFIFCCTGSSMLHRLSLVLWVGGYSLLRCTHCSDFCCCGAWASGVLVHQFSAPQHVGSPKTRDHTCVPCTGRWILNQWTTREVLCMFKGNFPIYCLNLSYPVMMSWFWLLLLWLI